MKVNITTINKWSILAEARYYELYAEFLRNESIIDSSIESEINEVIATIRNSVNESKMITALFKLNSLKHML